MGHRLNPLDASWLVLDSSRTPMHVGGLLIFTKPRGAGADYVAQLAMRLRESAALAAPWNYRLKRRLRGDLLASWQEDAQADLDYHFRQAALPEPGGERELGILVSRLHSNPLDLNRPPWECYLIEGLHDRRFALYCKLHHALLDAASFMRLLTDALSGQARQREVRPFWTQAPGVNGRAQAGDRMAAGLRGLLQGAQLIPSARAMGQAFTRLLRAGGKSADGLHAPYTAPRSALNTRIGAQRRFATQQYPLQRLQQLADASESTLDEIVLYLCATVLRRFFKEYNALPQRPLLAAVPGRVTEGEDDVSAAYGSIDFVSLGTQHASPLKRLAEIQDSMRASQEHREAIPEALLPAYTLATAAPFLLGQFAGVSEWVPAMFNLIVASMPGPERPLYLSGARLEALYPMFPLTQDCALTISCIHYAGTLNVGFTGARETLPSLQRMAVYMGQALEDLELELAEAEADE